MRQPEDGLQMTRRWTVLVACVLALTALAAKGGGLPLVAEVENSKGLKAGDTVLFEGKPVGEVDHVGFGEKDVVEVHMTIDADQRYRIRQSGLFVVNDPVDRTRPTIEYFVIDAKSPPAEPGARIPSVRSVAEVWMRRGRVSADELSRAMSQGVDQFRKNLEELRQSPEWSKLKDQVARLSAQLMVTGEELRRLLNDQLPKLQKELDDLYGEYQRNLEQERRKQEKNP
jgi:ABC-type transporter Mla subunit MlaD